VLRLALVLIIVANTDDDKRNAMTNEASPKAINIKAWGEAVSAKPQDRRSMEFAP
jgi:hypothetical protein